MASVAWIPKQREYERESQETAIQTQILDESDNPLYRSEQEIAQEEERKLQLKKQTSVAQIISSASSASSSSSSSSSVSRDPLGSAADDELDPLSAALAEESRTPVMYGGSYVSSSSSSSSSNNPKVRLDDSFVPWSAKKPEILAKYKTSDRVTITVAFLDDAERKPNAPVDKVKERLEELNEIDDQEKQKIVVSQAEYLQQIETMHTDLLQAWNNDLRVKSLKIAIQGSKLLCDVSVIKFYPSKFVLITEILDTFGRLVFDRLRGRSVRYDNVSSVPIFLPENFRPADVTQIARETCRNWFFKIASIRELIPRIFIEIALLPCYKFIGESDFESIIIRISQTLRGIGDPLVAAYARAYLARKGMEVTPEFNRYLVEMLFDHMQTMKALKNDKKLSNLAGQNGMSLSEYYDLFSPAIEWIMQCVAYQAPIKLFETILNKYKEDPNPYVLDYIISSFPPNFVAQHALVLCTLISDSDSTILSVARLYKSLALNLVLSSPPKDERESIFQTFLGSVTQFQKPDEYINTIEIFTEYPLKNCKRENIDFMLGDIVSHVTVDFAYEACQLQLQSVVQKILSYNYTFAELFAMKNFMTIVDLFRGETQIQVNKALLENFVRSESETKDTVLINYIFEVGKIVHDSINALSFLDEIRQIARLVTEFIRKVNYDRDFEKQLAFYGDCRRAFNNLDMVKKILVVNTIRLAAQTHKIVKGNLQRRSASFVRACVAFCFITIPSMDDLFSRLYLYQLAGQVALFCGCIPQAEALFKSSIALLQEVPSMQEVDGHISSTDDPLFDVVSSLSSQLIVVPGNPQHGPFYLIRPLIQVLQEHSWESGSIVRSKVMLKVVQLLCAQYQKAYIYHVPGIEANDVLYAADPDFTNEISEMLAELFDSIMQNISDLKSINDASIKRKIGPLCLDVIDVIVTNFEITPELRDIVKKLRNEAVVQSSDPNHMARVDRHVSRVAEASR